MADWLPPPALLAAFTVAALVLAVVPGPGVLYITTRTLAQGRAAGLWSAAGVALGNLANAGCAALGLAAVLAVSATAFEIIKWAGVAWLLWLAAQALRAPRAGSAAAAAAPPPRRVLRDGLLVALLNPKTTLFFAALLPAFLDPARAALPQSLLLGAWFTLLALTTDAAWVLAAGALAPRLQSTGAARAGRRASAAVYLGLAAWAALASRPPR